MSTYPLDTGPVLFCMMFRKDSRDDRSIYCSSLRRCFLESNQSLYQGCLMRRLNRCRSVHLTLRSRLLIGPSAAPSLRNTLTMWLYTTSALLSCINPAFCSCTSNCKTFVVLSPRWRRFKGMDAASCG